MGRDCLLCHDFELLNRKTRLLPFMVIPVADVLVVEKRYQDDDRYRNTKKPKQKGTAHIILLGATQARILEPTRTFSPLICSRGGKHIFL